jgi:hypothetical protein
MKLARCGILLGWIVFASLARADEWQVFRAEKDGFSVELPGRPQRMQKPIPTVFGDVQLVFHGLNDGGRMYFASFYDLPAGWNGDPVKALDAERDRGLHNTGCTLVSEKPVLVSGIAGRDVIADHPAGIQRVRCRNFVVGRRLFSLIVIGTKDPTVDVAAKLFFDSYAPLSQP